MSHMYSPVAELNLLYAFEAELGNQYYAEGFELSGFADMSALQTGWSQDPRFLGGLIPFATANGSGSIYALWRVDDREDVASLPVAVFGDEGGYHVVALGLMQLLQLLGFDGEPMVDWDGVSFYRSSDQPHSPGHGRYLAWLNQHFSLSPATDPGAIVGAAQAEVGQQFTSWANAFLQQ